MKLPNKESLESVSIQNPRPSGSIVSLPKADLRGQQVLAEGMQNLGEGVMRFAIAKDHSDYLTAKSKFQQASLNIERQLEQSNDYQSYGDNYKKFLEEFKNKDKSFEKIKNGFFGNAFGAELQSEIDLIEARGYERLANLAAKKESDASKVELLETIENNSNALLQTPDEATRSDILRTTSELIDSKVERNHISAEDAFKIKRSFAEGYALNRFNALTANEQIKVLNAKQSGKETYFEQTNTWTDAIPAEKKVVLYDRAKEQMRIDAERYQIQKEKAIRLENYQRKENIISQINQGADLSSINDEDWLRLDDNDKKMVRQLYMRKQGLGSSNPLEENTAFFKYQDLYANNPKAMAAVDPLEIEISVSPEKVAQVKKWQTDAFQNVSMPASEDKTRRVINSGISSLGIHPNSKKATPFKTRFYEEIDSFKEINKKDPTENDLEDIKDKLLIKATFDGLWGEDSKYLYEIDKKQFENIVVPEEDADSISKSFKEGSGRYPSKDEIKKTYIKSLGSFDLSYALPDDVKSLEEIKRAIDDERAKNPSLYDGVDTEQRAKEIAKRYYRGVV